ncbi:MAG: HlyD family efflux transporter periplasmic adaptor subunit [Devosia sp.]|nr:HlyD family efflux transporter periplasmic adaptor subunit [Devosia sp.]
MVQRLLLGIVALLIVLAIAWALWPRPLAVETAVISRRAIDVTVEDEGISRIKDVFTVSAPIAGKLMRLTLQPGDVVPAKKTIATIEPTEPGLLDARSRAVAQSNISAAQSAVDQAEAQQKQAQAQLDFAQNELKRSQSLAGQGIISEQLHQKAVLDVSVAATGLDAATASLVVRQRELDSAEASLIQGVTPIGSDDWVDVRAPAAGKVLSVTTKSEQVVAAGTPLLTVGDPADLEIAVDLLSRDAVAVQPGDPATIESWGGPPLKAVVDRVDPAAVTKVSALGIEEQRVTVVLKLLDNGGAQAQLGHDFRVVARIVVWHGDNLVAVPMGALFRQGNDWAVFAVDKGAAHLRKIVLGRQNADYAEVQSGLEVGETVVLHPGDQVTDGTSVTSEETGAS